MTDILPQETSTEAAATVNAPPANPPLAGESIISVKNVSRIYRVGNTKVAALRELSLDVPKGVLAALKGRSGSGKTTLLNLIGGLDSPTSGKVYFEDQSLGDLSEEDLTMLRCHRMGFIFQSFALMPTYSAFENVEFMLRLVEAHRQERVERARRCLKVVGLARWMDHR